MTFFSVFVVQIIYSKAVNGEIWITSDGRAYLVGSQPRVDQCGDGSGQIYITVSRFAIYNIFRVNVQQEGDMEIRLQRPDPRWLGTCIHDFQTPKWVQKQRRVEDSGAAIPVRSYEEPGRATCVAINTKFSLISIGTAAGAIHLTNFPSDVGIVPKSQKIEVPNIFSKATGQVTSLDWSADGYVVAVGWEHGWGIFSVGGKCLAFGIGVDEVIDEGKYVELFLYSETHANFTYRFQDTFMYGIKDLVRVLLY